MSATTRDKLAFVHAMARNTKATVRQCEVLMRYATTLQRLAEHQCNWPWTDVQERKRTNVVRKVAEVCAELTASNEGKGYIVPMHSRDPRGAVLKIRVPSGFSDSFGGDGICVPA